MSLILIALGLFLAYRILSKKKADGSPVLPTFVLPPTAAPAVLDMQAAMREYANKMEAEIVGRIMAVDSLKARADLHSRAADAATASTAAPAPKA